MLLGKKKFGGFQTFWHKVSQNKKLAIPLFALAVATLGFGIYSAVRAITAVGSGVTISYANTYRAQGPNAYSYDNSIIYYGTVNGDPDPGTGDWRPWSTHWYQIGSNYGMCLQASKERATGNANANTATSDTLKRIMLVTNDTISNNPYYSSFASSHDWDSITKSISNLRYRYSNLRYPCTDSRAHCTEGSDEEYVGYADYYYGCARIAYQCNTDISNSKVELKDAIYAVGHMMASATYASDYKGLSLPEQSTINGLITTINNWFSGKSVDEWELYTAQVDSEHQTLGWLEYKGPTTYSVRIRKVSSANTSTGLSGAAFRVCEIGDNDSDENCQGPFSTDSSGYTQYVTVGSTKIRWYETTYPSGYTCQSPLNTQGTYGYCYGAEVISDGETVVVENTPVPTAYIKIKKLISGQNSVSYAGLTVVGTVFSVKSGSTEVATITIGNDGTGVTNVSLPVGTYTISEKTATAGFVTNGATLTVKLDDTNTAANPATADYSTSSTACSSGSSACTFYNTIKTGSVSIRKLYNAYGISNQPLAGVTFTLTNQNNTNLTYTLGPTDSNGNASVSGVVFGTYTATENSSAANAAFSLLSSFTVNAQFASTGATAAIGDKTNELPDNPVISTVARNSNSTRDNPDKEIEISSSASVTDYVTVSGLSANYTYKFVGTLYDIAANTPVKDASGTDVTGTCDPLTTDSTGAASCDMVFSTFPSSNYINKELGIKQYLYKANNGTWIPVTVHNNNLDDTDQKVKVKNIEITSFATSTRSADNRVLAAGTVTVNDAVRIVGLTNGQSYTVEGVIDGTGVTASTPYSMTSATGTPVTINLAFTLDSTPYVGQSLNITITLKDSTGSTLVSYPAPSDGTETVTVLTPEIGTTAINGRDTSLNEHELEVGSTTIQDTVTYKGLVAGDQYTIKGEVHKLNADGTDSGTVVSTATKSFTATGEDNLTGEPITFNIDTIANCSTNNKLVLPCKFVVYEYIYYGSHSTPFAKHESASDTDQIVSVKQPTLVTAASDAQNDTSYLPLGTTTVIDRVTYDHLVPGQTYILKGKLIDLSTGNVVTNAAGTEVTATESFPAATTTDTIMVDSFSTFDSVLHYDYTLGNNQRKYVVYQTLYFGDIELVSHAENDDTNQQVQLAPPKIHTTATWKVNDNIDDDTNLLGVGDVIMKDYIEYEGLVEGEWYTVVASIYDPETHATLEINDESIENTKTFKADAKGKGTVAIEININTVSIQGRSFVVYEQLYRAQSKHGDGRLLDVHEEALDEGGQTFTVKIASIGTTAKDKADEDGVIDHEANQTIVDTVHYDGLLMDEEYTLYGYLWDRTNSQPLLDANGKRIEAYATFTTPRKSDNGDVTMEFPVDATNLPGLEIVVLEYLFSGDQNSVPKGADGYPDTTSEPQTYVTKHDAVDPPDSLPQTVRVSMRVGTQAVDAYDNDQKLGVGKVEVIDNLKYEGVTNGKTYKAKGWLVYKNDGKNHKAGDPVYGISYTCVENTTEEPATGETETPESEQSEEPETASGYTCTPAWTAVGGEQTFVAGSDGYEVPNGIVKINFEFDTRELIGEELVVYEELYLIEDDKEELVAEHKDLEDEGQTVVVLEPEIRTTAVDKSDGDKELINDMEVVITDKVAYTGLVKGTTYTLHGYLVSKTTGERVTASGITEVTHTFTATRDSGTEEIEFTIDTTGLSGKEIVVYEELYIDEEPDELEEEDKIAEHKDLNDENQTVWVKIDKPNTGLFTRFLEGAKQNGLFFIVGGVAVVSFAIWGTYRWKSRRKINF